MKRKLTLLFLVAMCAGLNVRAAFNLPKDAEGYYLISTPEDLAAHGQTFTAHYLR